MNENLKKEGFTKQDPLVSIVIPVYNAERTLSACLDSIFAQTYENYEVILIDDGSVDSSPAICHTYAKKKPDQTRYFRQKNSGPATARNTGIELCKGDYIAFVDADDRVSPKMIETMIRKANETGVQMVLCAYWLIHGNEKRNITYGFPEGIYANDNCRRIAMSVLTELKGGIPPYSWIRLTSRSVFESTGTRFESGLIRSEDYHFWAKIHFFMDNIYLLSKTPLYEYVENMQSITHRHVDGYWSSVLYIHQDLLDCLPQSKDIKEALALMLVKRALIALNNATYSKKLEQAKKEIITILQDKTLLEVLVSLEKTDPKKFMQFRFLMNHHLRFLVALKYLLRAVRYQLKR